MWSIIMHVVVGGLGIYIGWKIAELIDLTFFKKDVL